MHEVKCDTVKNRLYIKIAGFITEQELKETADKTIENVKKLKPGFSTINDISGVKAGDMPQNTADLVRAQNFIHKSGGGRVIRIVSSVITKTQFSASGQKAGYEKEADIAASVAEAEKMLDNKK
jgi:hypothetical protein